MTADPDQRFRPLTPDEVFAILFELLRQSGHYDPADSRILNLSPDSPTSEWLQSFNFGDLINAPAALNHHFNTDFDPAELQYFLQPSNNRRLNEFCVFIATRAQAADHFLFQGATSPADAFETVRSMLQRAGVNVADLRPDSPLASYLWQCDRDTLLRIACLAPGTLPPVHTDRPLFTGFGLALMIALATAAIAMALHLRRVRAVALAAMVLSFLTLIFTARVPSEVSFPGLTTFADLCNALTSTTPFLPGHFPIGPSSTRRTQIDAPPPPPTIAPVTK